MARYTLHNFGCRASQADGAALEAQLRAAGLDLAPDAASSDWVLFNTCTVTASADADLRHMVRRTHTANPAAKIAVTGCYAQRAPDEIAALPGVALVVGNSHKTQLVQLMTQSVDFHSVHVGDIFADHEFLATPVEGPGLDRSRPNLKIQDGCQNRCSFCIIPFVRGRSRSAPVAQVIDQVRALSVSHAEIVLTGINLGRYGREQGFAESLRLPDLLRTLLAETDIRRLRLSSVEPMDWSDDLIELLASTPRIARHIHAPLQSGSDAVLKRMFRKYRTRHYAQRLELAHRLMPDAAFGADVMTGFPGETDAEFAETLAFIESQPFTYLHAFTYSEREGTRAATYASPVPVQVRRERTRQLRDLSDRLHRRFQLANIGRTLDAVSLLEPGIALSSNYLRLRLHYPRPPAQLFPVKIGGMAQDLTESPFPVLPA